MKKKDEVKKAPGKAAKTSKPAKAVKAKSVELKAPVKTQKKLTRPAENTIATLRLEAPQAEQVSVAGSFNQWNPQANLLERDENGSWKCTLVIDPGEYEYRFFVDGEWCDDLANTMRRPNDFGTENCVLVI
jgi:hypothetical protein